MNEKEFDIQVRNLLRNAEEPVSPKLWEGVAAGLDRQRRVVPLRFWGWAGAVAAAAAVALFVFLKPTVSVPELPQQHSNPSIFMSEASGETQPAAELPVPTAQLPRKNPQVTAQRPLLAQAAADIPLVESQPKEEQPAPVAAAEEARPQQAAQPQTPSAPKEEGTQLLDQLLSQSAQSKQASGRGISLMAYGNMQGNQRGAVQGGLHRFGVPALNADVGIYNESPEISFSLPFSVGVGIKYDFSSRWAVGTGVRYTNLHRAFLGDYVGEGFRVLQTDIDNEQHWLGVPFNVYYSIVNRGRWRVNAFGGGSAEWLLDNDFLVHNSPNDLHYHQKGQYTQWSGTLGLGVEFKLSPVVGFYVDPSFRYFFDTERQPRSLRTIQPLRFDVEVGLRFSLGN